MKGLFFTAAVGVWLLAGCTKPVKVTVEAAQVCPPVPECRAEVGDIATHADLLNGFATYRAAYLQCKLYRDTLAACLDSTAEKP